MRKAGLVTGQILAALRDYAEPGRTPKELDALAARMLAEAGAVSSFKGYGSTLNLPPYPAVTCISVNDVVVHGIPHSKPLEEGDLVSIDFGAVLDGWNGDSAITFSVGNPEPEREALSQATEKAMWDGIAAAAVGKRLGDVGHAIQSSIKRSDRRYSIVRDFTGHGIGHEMHEDPDVPNYGRPGKGIRIVDGLTIAIEPIITLGSSWLIEDPDEWTMRTKRGGPAAHWEHTIAITKQGLWVLTALDGGKEELGKRGILVNDLAERLE
jgi:methionyl aminopeptidase